LAGAAAIVAKAIVVIRRNFFISDLPLLEPEEATSVARDFAIRPLSSSRPAKPLYRTDFDERRLSINLR
jgi:hypothetical protein